MKTIVTAESLAKMIKEASTEKQIHIVGRALVALYNRQTAVEQNVSESIARNRRGFCSADSKSGSSAARHYLSMRTLNGYELRRWLSTNFKTGRPYICKYFRQLNEVANEKLR